MNLSLNLGYISLKLGVLNLECMSIVREYNYFNEDIVLMRKRIIPPPAIVSTVLHNILGVNASKSYKINILYVFPKTF